MSIYEKLLAAGCTMDNHESDLYVKATMKACAMTKGQPGRSFFRSQTDGTLWIEIPFAYDPFWPGHRGK